jgi:hypothetical protein
VIASGNLHLEQQAIAVLEDGADIISFGGAALANPDLPRSFAAASQLKAFDPKMLAPIANINSAKFFSTLDLKTSNQPLPDDLRTTRGVMHKLYIYAHLIRFQSRRRFAREAQHNTGLMWLIGRSARPQQQHGKRTAGRTAPCFWMAPLLRLAQ